MPSESVTSTQEVPLNLSADWLDYLPNALAILALDGTVRALNRTALRLLNFRSSQVIGRHFTHFLHSVDPPLLAGGFRALLAQGGATFSTALRGSDDHFVQVEIRLIVLYDDQARESGVLVMSNDGDAENFLLRQAVAKVADQTSRAIAYSARDESLWPKLFTLCQTIFKTPGGWLIRRAPQGNQPPPIVFGPWQEALSKLHNGLSINDCPCVELNCLIGGLNASNSLDCPWLAVAKSADTALPIRYHHAVAPILNGADEHVGDLCLITPAGHIFHRNELILMEAITDQIGQAVDRGEIRFPDHGSVFEGIDLLTAETVSPELAEVFERILVNLATVVPLASAGIFLQEAAGLRLVAAVDHPQTPNQRGHLFPSNGNLLNQEIIRTRSRIILADVRQDSRFQPWGGLDYIRGWMGLPLIVNDTVIGIISLDSQQVDGFSPRDGEVAQAFADQAAIAVEKVRLAEDLRLEKRNLELLYQLSQSLIVTVEPQAVAAKALDLVTEIFNNCCGDIYVLEKGQEFLKLLASKNYPPDIADQLPNQPYLHIGKGIAGTAVDMRRPILVSNIFEDPRWLWIPDLDLGVRSLAAIPLIAQDEVVGLLMLSSPQINVFADDYHILLQSIAVPVALTLQNARLFAAEHRGRQEAEMLHNATAAVTLDLRLEQILQLLLERLQQVVPFDSACVMLLDGDKLHGVAERKLPKAEEVLGKFFPTDNSLFARLQRDERAYFVDDVGKISDFRGWGGTSNTRGWMGVPLIHRGDVLGYITLDSLQVGSYGQREATLAQAFANQVAVTLVNAQLLRDTQRSVSEQQEVSGMMRGLNGAVSLAGIRGAVAQGLHRLIGASAVEIALYQEDRQEVTAERSTQSFSDGKKTTSTITYGFDESAALTSTLQGQSHIAQDITAENQWPVERAWTEQGYRSGMALPLQGSERILGHIQLFWRDQLFPDQAIHFSLRQICDGVAMAVERLTLWQQATRRADELQMLIQLSGVLRGTEGSEEIVQIVLAACLDIFQADQGYLLVPCEDEEALEVTAQLGSGPIAPAQRLSYTNSISGQVFRTGESYCSPNLFSDPLGFHPNLRHWADLGINFISAIYAPLRSGDRITGVLALTNMETVRTFSQTNLRLLNAIAEIAGAALHRASLMEGLEQRVDERTAALAQANLRLLELDKLKSDFVANVSHELRTPLTNIKLNLELVQKGRPERREHYLQVIESETEQLYELIESIIDLSTLDAWGNPTIDFTTVSLDALMETIFHRFQEQASVVQLELVYQTGPIPLFIRGSHHYLGHLAANLVANAIRYTPPGGQVVLALETNSQNEAGIVVRDTGIGIPADEIDAIFDRFYRSKNAKEAHLPGAGLGLSIVKNVAEAHGGHIAVKSAPGVGTTFSVWFPRTEME